MPLFSVLIPTYNRREKLKVVLEQLFKQERIEEGEVIVGIDGSIDGTKEWLESHSSIFNSQFSIFRIENSGRSVIRNKLLEKARGEIIIFIQDDIVVEKGWLKAHLEAQKRVQGAQVGNVTWYPEITITPYMQWLENGGHLLDFSTISEKKKIDFWHFYMGNISFPKKLIEGIKFDESMSSYGWEDILFGYEFVSKGNNVFYCVSAKAYHWDEYKEENLKVYMQKVGCSAVFAENKYPGLGFIPPLWKRSFFRMLIFFGSFIRFLLPQKWKWYLDMKKWFLEACDREQRDIKNKYSLCAEVVEAKEEVEL